MNSNSTQIILQKEVFRVDYERKKKMVHNKKVDEGTRAEKRGFGVSRKSSAPYSRSDFRIGKKCSGVLRIEASTKGDKKVSQLPR
ncbi:hypothetical protein TNCV_4891451 [Trichonephila clavipes]|nr:hypothetical protein TNCV_4891451 [Trichonephila clavipes]